MESPILSWHSPPHTPILGNDEIHVWRASLDLPVLQSRSLLLTLAAEELRRAERYRFQEDREHFIIARGLLRTILGGYLDIEPGELQFHYNPNGKPALDGVPGGDTLHFNLSHSHGLALFAVTHGRDIGVDLEHIRPHFDEDQIAERFFSFQEVAALHALPRSMQKEAFFACWTRKEAYIKGTGQGLSLPLDQFDVSVVPGEPAALISTRWDPQEASRWSLQELNPGTGYVGALAVAGHGWRLKCWQCARY